MSVTGSARVALTLPGLTIDDIARPGQQTLGRRGRVRVGPASGLAVPITVVEGGTAGTFGIYAVAQLEAANGPAGLNLSGLVRPAPVARYGTWFFLLVCGLLGALTVGAATGGDAGSAFPAAVLTVVVSLIWWFGVRGIGADAVRTLSSTLGDPGGAFHAALHAWHPDATLDGSGG